LIKLSYTSNTLATNTAEGSNGQGGNSSSTTAVSLVSEQNANYPQPIGTVRAYAMSGGRVGIIVDGSTPNTELTINPLGLPQRKGYAHSFAYGEATRNHLLNVGQVTVNSGAIADIEGFQDAVLSGPVVVSSPNAIDRIAFFALEPGASITTGGDLGTLDVLNGITLSGAGTGVSIGRDLNLLNVGQNMVIANGASFAIGRDLGLVSQPPKGTGTGSNVLLLNFNTLVGTTITTALPASVSTFIQGGIVIGPGSSLTIGRNIVNGMYVSGSIQGFSRFLVHTNTVPTSPTLAPPNPVTPVEGEVNALGGVTP
jgi:hypothetical protein